MKFNNVLKVVSAPFKIHAPGEAPVVSPSRFHSYYSLDEIPPTVLREITLSYTRVFSEPPWSEDWSIEDVEAKIRNELIGPSCLTVMDGNSECKVGGFSWGAIVPVDEVARRTVEAHKFKGARIQEHLEKKLRALITGSKVYFLDDIAILREFRGGMSPLQFLARPLLEVAVKEEAFEAVSWTSSNSKMAAFTIYGGFSTIVAEIEGALFVNNPDIRPLVKILQNFNGQTIEKIIGSMSKLGRRAA